MSAHSLKARKSPGKSCVLKLYVSGATRRSQVAIRNLNAICEQYLEGHYDLEVVDIYQSPLLAQEAEILAAPTLVKHLPSPMRRLIGDLSQHGKVLMLLGLKPKEENA